MFKYFPKFIVIVSVLFLFYLGYEGFLHNSAKPWSNFDEPKPADFTSLEQEEQILERFEQIPYRGLKEINPTLFTKPNIFESIQ